MIKTSPYDFTHGISCHIHLMKCYNIIRTCFIILVIIYIMRTSILLVIPALFALSGFAYADDTVVILNTTHGHLVFEFFSDDAPAHVKNFVMLAKDGFYTGSFLYDVPSGLMFHGGDLSTQPDGIDDHTLSLGDESNDIAHDRGILSMLKAHNIDNPRSQIFIIHPDDAPLDGNYTVFGRLATQDSYDTLDYIISPQMSQLAEASDAKILSVQVTMRDDAISSGIQMIHQGMPARVENTSIEMSDDVYTNEDIHLMIKFPYSWVVQHPNATGLPDVVATPDDSSDASIGIYVETSGNRTFNEIALSKIDDIKKFTTGAFIEENHDMSSLGRHDTLVTDASFDDTPNGTITKIRQVLIVDEHINMAYTFLFSADIGDFDRYLLDFDNTLQTFEPIDKSEHIHTNLTLPTTDIGSITQTAHVTKVVDTYTGPTRVSDVSYNWDDNVLVISFTTPIGPLVSLSYINIIDDDCATGFGHEQYRGRTLDHMSVRIEPNDVQRLSLASMFQPHAYIHEGAFHDASGNVLESTEIAMTTTGTPPGGDNPCVITYGSNEQLLDAYAHDYAQTLQAVHDGFKAWSDLNPDLEFVWVEHNPLIWINWAEYQSEYVGLACIWCLGYEASMDVILYGYDCEGKRIYHSPNSVRNTVAHEVGHILGLEHHVDQTHLMHGTDYISDPFQTIGYVVPDLLPEGFIGQPELVSRHDALGHMLNSTSDRIDQLKASIERYASQFGDLRGNTLYFDTNSQVRQYDRMVNEYDDLIDEYNDMVDEYNTIAGELNCMYEAKPPGH